METKSTRIDWGLWLGWVFLSTVGGIVGNYIATSVATSWAVAGAFFGAGMGITQCVILRQGIPQAGWWVLAAIAGAAVGFSANMKLLESGILLTRGGIWIGALTGTLQWFILRKQTYQSGWWVLASTVGWEAGWTVGSWIAPGTVMSAGLTFAIASATTGGLLVWLLQHDVVEPMASARRRLQAASPLPVPDSLRRAPGWPWGLGVVGIIVLVDLLGLGLGNLGAGPFGPRPTPIKVATETRTADGMTMVYVPAGTFQMGSNWRDRSANEYEKPPHLVTLDAFWIDRTEVTNAQHAHCVAAGVCQISAFAYDARFNGADYPVVGVGWQDAADYCRWVGGRLPTEAEWEYAARGPGGHIYPWGNDPPDDTLLNYNGNVGDTTKVGSYPKGQSWVGALDMAGNVWEWVNDWYGEYPSEPQVNPTGPTSGEYRVARGSSWDDDRNYARVAIRSRIAPDLRYIYIGFRCASGLP